MRHIHLEALPVTSSFLRDLFAGLVYPGALSVALLVLGVGRILGGPASGGRAISGLVGGVLGKGPVAYAAAAICVLLALARLPWPNLPWQAPAVAQPWLLWALMEASAIAAVLPGLASSAPDLSRAAVRQAQLGASGRLPI